MSLLGVNLVGMEFGNLAMIAPPERPKIDYYAAKHIVLFRVPIAWPYLQPKLGGPLDPSALNNLLQTLDYIGSRKASFIVDVHAFGRYGLAGKGDAIGSSTVPIAAFTDFWVKLASALKSNASQAWCYGYDIMNEPHDLPVPWQGIAQATATAIRTVDPHVRLVVEGDDWSQATSWAQGQVNADFAINDPNWIPSTHSYWDNGEEGLYPFNSLGSYACVKAWGLKHAASPLVGVQDTQYFADYCARHGHKQALVGEFGVPSWPRTGDSPAASAEWNAVLGNFCKQIEAWGFDGTYWAGGNWEKIGQGGADYKQAVNYVTSCEPQGGVDASALATLVADNHKP